MFVEPCNGLVDFVLFFGVIIAVSAAANGNSLLSELADMLSDGSPVYVEQSLYYVAVNSLIPARMCLFKVIPDQFFIRHLYPFQYIKRGGEESAPCDGKNQYPVLGRIMILFVRFLTMVVQLAFAVSHVPMYLPPA